MNIFDRCKKIKNYKNNFALFRLRKIQDQSINGIKKHQISFKSSQKYFQNLKSVISLKIGFFNVTGFSFLF